MKSASGATTVERSTSTSTQTRLSEPASPDLMGWRQDAAARFNDRMLDRRRPFPCIFGVDAVKRQTLRFAFIPDDGNETTALSEALREFITNARDLGKRTSLVVFFERNLEEGASIDEHEDRFWKLLQGLHDRDDHPWPEEIPTDTEDPEWEFSFAGMPMFVVANTPAHQLRQSRYFERFAITFQPRFVFDDIRGDSRQGKGARKIIRGRLHTYDAVEPSSTLGDFGADGNREWGSPDFRWGWGDTPRTRVSL